MEGSEGICHQKNPVTPPGIDPGTVRLVAQRFNHYAIQAPVPDSTRRLKHADIRASGGIRTRNSNRRVAADPRNRAATGIAIYVY